MHVSLDIPASLRQDRAPANRDAPPPENRHARASSVPFAVAIFLSAFLLFQVQLLLGKEVLPIFGGAPAVWTVCVLIFQLLYLAGYGYSHALAVWLPVKKQVVLHGLLLFGSAVLLAVLGFLHSAPIGPGLTWIPPPGANPTWTITKFLLSAIGLPFFLLSATSPSMQHWFSISAPHRSPYRLYALSNVGSFLGLLSYPFLIEPRLRLATQGWLWISGFALFLLCYVFSARRVVASVTGASSKPPPANSPAPDKTAFVPWARRLVWVSLAACASVLLLATTNLISEDVAVSPFLWVLELSLYLLSFIVCFESDRWYRRGVFFPLLAASVALVIVVSLPNAEFSFISQLFAFSSVLFAGCMVCHGEAARLRPSPEALTVFYFSVATGGAVGGLIVSLLAPAIFPNYWEYPLGVLGSIVVVLSVSQRDLRSWWYRGPASLGFAILAGVALLGPKLLAAVWPAGSAALHLPPSSGIWAAFVLALAAVLVFLYQRRQSATLPPSVPSPAFVRTASRFALAALAAGLIIPQKAALYHVIDSSRNFYGVLSVVTNEQENYVALRYGNTLHGFQYADSQRRRQPTGYYGPGSGANIAIRNWRHHPMRVGLVGMGVGTLAALAQPGDVYRFYEINPDVYRLSSGLHPQFTFLPDSPGRVQVVLGDARVSLEREARQGEFQKLDILVLDAFSSDAIPMHLLTRQAFVIYAQHLRSPQSIIAIHISNQTLDLRPVLAGISQEFGYHMVRIFPLLPTGPFSQSDWLLLSRDAAALSQTEISQHGESLPPTMQPIFWTDDYCDVLHVIRWHD